MIASVSLGDGGAEGGRAGRQQELVGGTAMLKPVVMPQWQSMQAIANLPVGPPVPGSDNTEHIFPEIILKGKCNKCSVGLPTVVGVRLI